MQQHRALILRSNRFLGSSLVDKGLVSSSDLEQANEKLMHAIQASDFKGASILTPLIFEQKVLDEGRMIEAIVEEHDLGLVDLNFCQLKSIKDLNVDLSLCWATSTVPFDRMGDTHMVATCYYMSAPVLKAWEEALGDVLWYATSMSSISKGLEQLETIAEEEAAAEDADADDTDA